MKFEKLTENKIRITFNSSDLQEKNIDVHSFMSNSIESQSLFLYMLDEAEREIGFITDNYKLSIQALALSNGNFIITVTRLEKEILKPNRVQVKRKTDFAKNNTLIYKFQSFDDYCNFINFLTTSFSSHLKTLETAQLYKYNNLFFLIIKCKPQSTITNLISEFASPVQASETMISKIRECGAVVS